MVAAPVGRPLLWADLLRGAVGVAKPAGAAASDAAATLDREASANESLGDETLVEGAGLAEAGAAAGAASAELRVNSGCGCAIPGRRPAPDILTTFHYREQGNHAHMHSIADYTRYMADWLEGLFREPRAPLNSNDNPRLQDVELPALNRPLDVDGVRLPLLQALMKLGLNRENGPTQLRLLFCRK